MSKFFDEFRIRTNNKYSMLNFNSAVYYDETKHLIVKFTISAYDRSLLTESDEAEIKRVIEEMFPDISIEIKYERTIADASVIVTRIYQFLNEKYPFYLNQMKKDSVKAESADNCVTVEITLESTLYNMMLGKVDEEIETYLSKNFNAEIDIKFIEIPNSIGDTDLLRDNIVYSSAKLIEVKQDKKLYTRFKNGKISTMPSYISEIDKPIEGVTLCGKVSSISFREYDNKKFDPTNANEPEKLKLFKWTLNDTTKNIDCVAFPLAKQESMLNALQENMHVVCYGNVSESKYGGLQYVVSDISLAEINFDSIKQNEFSKPIPSAYRVIAPKPYEEVGQASLFEKRIDTPSDLRNNEYVIFDLETTGLDTQTAKIIEIAACKIINGKIVQTFESLVNPEMPIPPQSTAVNHINDDMVAFAPKFDLIAADFFKFTRGATLVAHNISYDFPILSRQSKSSGYLYNNELIDTLALARQYIKGTRSFSLENLSKMLEIDHNNAHRALSDVIATAKLFIHICSIKDGKI